MADEPQRGKPGAAPQRRARGFARAGGMIAPQMRTVADQRAVDASRRVTLQAESALGNAGELVMQARDLMVAAGNATYSDAERRDMGDALRGIRAQLLSIANQTDGAGVHLFGGQGASQLPFVDAPGGVIYAGAPGETRSAGSEPLPLSLDAIERSRFTSVSRTAVLDSSSGSSMCWNRFSSSLFGLGAAQ